MSYRLLYRCHTQRYRCWISKGDLYEKLAANPEVVVGQINVCASLGVTGKISPYWFCKTFYRKHARNNIATARVGKRTKVRRKVT